MSKDLVYDLIGVGIGPFNLSLAALADDQAELKSLFLERKSEFSWHPELMMPDVTMQTSFLKDLVTGVDPKSSYTYLNYLLENQLLYSFLNTGRTNVSRQEFEGYARWVSTRLSNLEFSANVENIDFDGDLFHVSYNSKTIKARHVCLGTGPVPRIPDVAIPYLCDSFFHPKCNGLKDLNLKGKSVVVVGGGQTGSEIYLNALSDHWGRPKDVKFVSRRSNLFPLDESPFVNEYFTPDYVRQFSALSPEVKAKVVSEQKLSSDGITGELLDQIYRKLFSLRLEGRDSMTKILPSRSLEGVSEEGGVYKLEFKNSTLEKSEFIDAEVVILATGFSHSLPSILSCVNPSGSMVDGYIPLSSNYEMKWEHMQTNHIFLQNFGRMSIGISEPQTSLMAWRSGKIINHILGREVYNTSSEELSFIRI